MTTGVPVVHLLPLRVMPEGAFTPKVPGTKYQNAPVVLQPLPGSRVDYTNQANGVVGLGQLRRGRNTNSFL